MTAGRKDTPNVYSLDYSASREAAADRRHGEPADPRVTEGAAEDPTCAASAPFLVRTAPRSQARFYSSLERLATMPRPNARSVRVAGSGVGVGVSAASVPIMFLQS